MAEILENVKSLIDSKITTNGKQEITGAVLNNVLQQIVGGTVGSETTRTFAGFHEMAEGLTPPIDSNYDKPVFLFVGNYESSPLWDLGDTFLDENGEQLECDKYGIYVLYNMFDQERIYWRLAFLAAIDGAITEHPIICNRDEYGNATTALLLSTGLITNATGLTVNIGSGLKFENNQIHVKLGTTTPFVFDNEGGLKIKLSSELYTAEGSNGYVLSVKPGTGLYIDNNGLNVKLSSSIVGSKDSRNPIQIYDDGSGIQGLSIGIGTGLTSDGTLQVKIASGITDFAGTSYTNPIQIDSTSGDITLKLGKGLHAENGMLGVKVDSNKGLNVDAVNGVYINAGYGLGFSSGELQVAIGSGLTDASNKIAINLGSGLEFYDASGGYGYNLKATIKLGPGLKFNDEGALCYDPTTAET